MIELNSNERIVFSQISSLHYITVQLGGQPGRLSVRVNVRACSASDLAVLAHSMNSPSLVQAQSRRPWLIRYARGVKLFFNDDDVTLVAL
jgi:hypothetical protein